MTVMKKSNKDDAVSPVIGVMLMLVVTIIIAALVSSFASGITTSQDRAPVATLDVSVSAADGPKGSTSQYVQIEHLGGETLKLGDLRIVTTYMVPEKYDDAGKKTTHAFKVIRKTIDGSVTTNFAAKMEGAPFIHQTHTLTNTQFKLSDRAANNRVGSIGGVTFANSELSAGSTLSILKSPFLGFDSSDKVSYGFGEGSVVHVTISHIPSNKIIFDKDVIATW